MKKKYKVLIAHSAQQHSFRTAVALKENGYLFKYITTVYDKKGSLTSIGKKFLRGDDRTRANTRKCDDLNDNEVIQFCELLGLMLLFLQRVDRSKKIYNLLDRYIVNRFNKKVAKYAIKNDVDMIIMYDTLCYKTFEIIKSKSPNIKRVIDMSAPNYIYMDKIFREDLGKNKEYSDELEREISTKSYKRRLDESLKEINLADYFIVASNFTKKSLEYSGKDGSLIFTCPYGIDGDMYKYKKKQNKDTVNCIFVGRITQKKGVFYFLEAIKSLDESKFTFKLIGNYDSESKYFDDFKYKCEFTGHITKDKVIKACQDADIMVFSSLADGFGLSALEAMSCGVPVICSSNAGVSDLIIDGYNGFIISPGDSNSIYEKLTWAQENKDILRKMGLNAKKTAENQSWDNYNKKIKNSIDLIFKN